MKRIFFLNIFCLLFFTSKAQIVSLNKNEFAKLKNLVKKDKDAKQHWAVLMKEADEAMNSNPNPADTILSEGLLQGDPRKTKSSKALADMQKVYALALAYKITGAQKYLAKTSTFLLAWATRNQPQGNPINDTNLERMIFAYDLVKDELGKDVSSVTSLWLTKVGLQEVASYYKAKNRGSLTYLNNWNAHRIKEVALVAWTVGNDSLKNWAIEAYKNQIAKNLNPDGSSFDFHERDALHYHVYDVDPLMVAAAIMKRANRLNGYEYKAKTGSSLKGSVNWLIPFFTEEKTHAEFVNSKIAFDKKRAANGEKGYIAGTLFKPEHARTSIALAAYFDRKMLAIYQANAHTKSKYPTWQFVLNEVKR